MKTLITTTLQLLFSISVMAQPWMTYSDPGQAGFDTAKLNNLTSQFDQLNSASYMVIHKGNVVLSLGDVSRRYMCHSMRKSIMSAAIGNYVASGEINLYHTLAELEINDKQSLTEREKQARIHDLITARSGIYHPAAYEPRSMAENRPERGSALPGEQFFYNNWDFNTLATVFEKSTGKDFFEAVHSDLVEPLGMEDLRMEDMHYRYNEASEHPAYLFKMSTRDLARFGQLYLNNGLWEGNQLVPEDWVELSTRPFSRETFREGYGYLWWTDESTFTEPTYYASGLGGHRLYVFPESEMVIVHRVNTYINQFESNDNINQLVQLTLDAYSGKTGTDATLEPLEINKQQIAELTTSKTFNSFAGNYNHRLFGNITASTTDGIHYLSGNKLGSFRLIPTGKNSFSIEDLPELHIIFEKTKEASQKGQVITEFTEQRIPKQMIFYY